VRIFMKVLAIISAWLLVTLAVWTIVFRFQNPTLTDTQLTVIQWPAEVLAGIAAFTFMGAVHWLTKKRWK
jgi:hypothetical protein